MFVFGEVIKDFKILTITQIKKPTKTKKVRKFVGKLSKTQIGTLDADFWGTMLVNEKEYVTKYVWSNIKEDIPMWEQYFSIDDGENWEPNWLMKFHPEEKRDF